MAIPGPGTAISINTIVGEFGGTVPHSISEYYRGGGLVPNTPGNASVPTSGAIALGNFYGTANRNAYTLTISADTQNYDVYTNRGPAYIAGSTDITVQINPGVTVGSSSVPAYALLVPSAFNPGDNITIVNNGAIRGMAGSGGNGGEGNSGTSYPGSAGSAGGNALYVNRPTTVTNNGTIAAGGGGGGGGAGANGNRPTPKNPIPDRWASGGGGGGGAGYTVGSGGGAGSGSPSGGPSAQPGNSGTFSAGGSGGAGASAYSGSLGATAVGGTGGAGGGGGAAGSTGGDGVGGPGGGGGSGGAGGASANYITGNSFVTWPATGTRQGGVA